MIFDAEIRTKQSSPQLINYIKVYLTVLFKFLNFTFRLMRPFTLGQLHLEKVI